MLTARKMATIVTQSGVPASDPSMVFGAVIGKVLQPMASRQGLLPVLVALQ
jgi:hypothetical protein